MRDGIEIVGGDITELDVDAIVNAANESLLGGGGVDGAIHAAAGPELTTECRAIGGCPAGEVRLTRGHRLKARWIVHTVGPIWSGGRAGEDALLASCYRKSLELARDRDFASIAFPAISTGVFGFPLERATRIALAEIAEFAAANTQPARIVLVCFSERALRTYRELAARLPR